MGSNIVDITPERRPSLTSRYMGCANYSPVTDLSSWSVQGLPELFDKESTHEIDNLLRMLAKQGGQKSVVYYSRNFQKPRDRLFPLLESEARFYGWDRQSDERDHKPFLVLEARHCRDYLMPRRVVTFYELKEPVGAGDKGRNCIANGHSLKGHIFPVLRQCLNGRLLDLSYTDAASAYNAFTP